jgi:hypothetical protein
MRRRTSNLERAAVAEMLAATADQIAAAVPFKLTLDPFARLMRMRLAQLQSVSWPASVAP